MIRNRRVGLLVQGAALLLAAQTAWAQAPVPESAPYKTDFKVEVAPDLQAQVPEQYRKAGVLNVATNPNTPPTIFVSEDNKTLAGREVDVMSAVAHRLGLEPNWVKAGAFGNIVPGLASGRYDAALANVSVTSDRLKQVDLVSYFNSNRLGLVRTKADSPAQPQTEILDLCGETIGAGSGTTNADVLVKQSEACLAAGRKAIDVQLFPSRPAGVQAVLSGRAPGFFGPLEGLRYMVSVSNDALALAGDFQVGNDYIAVGLQKDSPLTPVIAAALNSLIKDGTYAKILAKWELTYGAVPEARTNGAILNESAPAAGPRGG